MAWTALLIVENGLRCRLARFKLCAHFLQADSELFNLCLQCLHSAMLFQKFVEQHRVHGFVADAEDLALGIASNQVGIHLLHLLSHETKLRVTLGVKVVLVTKSHRPQSQDRFACVVHWLDLVLKALRGGSDAEPAIWAYNHLAPSDRHVCDASDKGGRLNPLGIDAYSAELPSSTSVADINIVTASGEIDTG